MGMASQIQQAIAGEEDLLVFDEDRSAANLLVPGCLSGPEVRVLSTLLAEERERLIRVFPMIDEWTGGLRLPETRYAEPAIIYPATFDR